MIASQRKLNYAPSAAFVQWEPGVFERLGRKF